MDLALIAFRVSNSCFRRPKFVLSATDRLPCGCATWHILPEADKPKAASFEAALVVSTLSGNGHSHTKGRMWA